MTWIIGDAVDVKNQASLKSARAGRASRAGARAGRIVRLVRMVKLYKYMSREQEKLDSSISGSRSGLPRSGSGTIQDKIRDTAARHRPRQTEGRSIQPAEVRATPPPTRPASGPEAKP